MNILVLFCYGNVQTIDDVADFYKDILHGNGTDDQIQKGVAAYQSLTTADPLGANTNRIGRHLAKRLTNATGEEWTMFVAGHHTYPFIDDVAKKCAALDPQRVVTLGLAPFDSVTGKNAYERKFKKIFRSQNTSAEIIHVSPFYNNKLFIECMIDRAKTAQRWLPAEVRNEAEIVFTVHSKPGIPAAHQIMIQQYNELAEQIAAALHCENYHIAYRSGHPPPQRWLGPDVLDAVDKLGERQVPAVIFIEALSVIENLEVVQEVTKDAVEKARGLGMEAVQSEYLNSSVDFVEALKDHLFKELKIQD